MARRKAAPKKATKQDKVAEAVTAPAESIYIGQSDKAEFILLKLANRHGLVTGATGTGKTVTLQGLAESFSDEGVPVFCADVKGDLSGLAEKGVAKGWIEDRAKLIGYDVELNAYPVIFWDLFGEKGHPIRTTITELGPLLLSRLLELSEAQEGVLNIAIKIAAGALIVIEVLTFPRGILSNRISISFNESMATPHFPTSPNAMGWSVSYPIWVGRSNATESPVCPLARLLR